MIIVPEIQTVVILVPRTGSGALKKALLATYPEALRLYRHMEADGVPAGYDRWTRVGVVRNPLDRLWSLYKFIGAMDGAPDGSGKWENAYVSAQRRSVEKSFSEWITDNQTVFTSPYDSAGQGRFWPGYTVRHPLPENWKSQFLYLRPDLGTKVFRFSELVSLEARLGITLPRYNCTPPSPVPPLSQKAHEHVRRVFAWDFEAAALKARGRVAA